MNAPEILDVEADHMTPRLSEEVQFTTAFLSRSSPSTSYSDRSQRSASPSVKVTDMEAFAKPIEFFSLVLEPHQVREYQPSL